MLLHPKLREKLEREVTREVRNVLNKNIL